MFSPDQEAVYTPLTIRPPRGRLTAVDKATVVQVLGLMDEEMIFEWSYQLRGDLRPEAHELYELIREYLDQSFM